MNLALKRSRNARARRPAERRPDADIRRRRRRRRGPGQPSPTLAAKVTPAVVNIASKHKVAHAGDDELAICLHVPKGSPFEDFFKHFNDGSGGQRRRGDGATLCLLAMFTNRPASPWRRGRRSWPGPRRRRRRRTNVSIRAPLSRRRRRAIRPSLQSKIHQILHSVERGFLAAYAIAGDIGRTASRPNCGGIKLPKRYRGEAQWRQKKKRAIMEARSRRKYISGRGGPWCSSKGIWHRPPVGALAGGLIPRHVGPLRQRPRLPDVSC